MEALPGIVTINFKICPQQVKGRIETLPWVIIVCSKICPLQVTNRNPLDTQTFLRSMTRQNGGLIGISHTSGTTATVVGAPGKVKTQIPQGNLC